METQFERISRLSKIIEELNDTSSECLSATDELEVIHLKEENLELKKFLRRITLQLQKHKELSDAEKNADFQNAYRLYAKYNVDSLE